MSGREVGAAGRVGRAGRMEMRFAIAALCLSVACFGALPRARAQEGADAKDTIRLAGGTELSVDEVKKETFQEVRYRIGKDFNSYKGEEVVEVIHGNPPYAFRKADEARLSGDYAGAVDQYNKAKSDKAEWVKPYATFYQGEAQRLWGEVETPKLNDALQTYQGFLKEFADHRFVPDVQYRLGEVSSRLKDYSTAAGAFEKLAGGEYGKRWALKGRVGKGYVALWQGKHGDAINVLTGAVDEAGDDLSVSGPGLVGMGQAFLAAKRFDEAMDRFGRVAAQKGQLPEFLAKAYLGLGDAQLAKTAGDKDGVKRALLSYLRVAALYPGQANEAAQALYQAAQCWEKVGEKARADGLYAELKKRYSASPWAAKAK